MSDTERRLTFRSAGVIGLGLIGGSVARDLAALGVRVLAYDRDPATMEMARAEGVVDEPLDASLAGLHDAEVVIVAVPVSSLSNVLAAAPRLPHGRLITDVGSTKRSAIATAEAVGIGERFVGSHPMAGDHRSGWTASRRGLFAGARVYLCRTRDAHEDALTLAHELWRALGACPEVIDADALLPAIAALETQLQRLRAALTRGEQEELRAFFGAARAWTTRKDEDEG
jgi:prephenate dehydrogenase